MIPNLILRNKAVSPFHFYDSLISKVANEQIKNLYPCRKHKTEMLKSLWPISLATSCTSQYFWRLKGSSVIPHHMLFLPTWRSGCSACIIYTYMSADSSIITDKNNKPQRSPTLEHKAAFQSSWRFDNRLNTVCTHSRYLVHGAGSDMAMKKQLVSIVNIMNRLNNVLRLRKVICRLQFLWYGNNVSPRWHKGSCNPMK